MRQADIIAAIFLLLTGLVMIFIIIPAQTYPGEEYGVPPATVPTAAMGVVTVMSGILLIQRLRGRKKTETARPSPVKRFQWLHIAGFTTLLFVAVAAIKFIHFIPGGILTLAVLMVVAGQRKPLTIIMVAVPVPCIVYAALWYGLRIPLP